MQTRISNIKYILFKYLIFVIVYKTFQKSTNETIKLFGIIKILKEV